MAKGPIAKPRIYLRGTPAIIPSVYSRQATRVTPKTHPILDKDTEVKNLEGVVLFRGTPRQWQKWARAQEQEHRRRAGLLS